MVRSQKLVKMWSSWSAKRTERMTTEFLSAGVWAEITAAVRRSKKPCFAAVAYAGPGASRQLPLPKGSCLVVNASEACVRSSATCPAELIKLLRRGVRIFSQPSLHAKAFVLGKAAYVGSTNVSSTSAHVLTEAAIRTTDPATVRAVRAFIESNCVTELGPLALARLAKLYRPPRFPGSKTRRKPRIQGPTLPRVFLMSLQWEDWSEQEQELHAQGVVKAKQFRRHPRAWIQEDFRYSGRCPYKRGDVVVQISDEGRGKYLVHAPASVLHVTAHERVGRRLFSFVYLERPARRRLQLNSVARAVRCTKKRLRTNGLVRDREFVRRLMNVLSELP